MSSAEEGKAGGWALFYLTLGAGGRTGGKQGAGNRDRGPHSAQKEEHHHGNLFPCFPTGGRVGERRPVNVGLQSLSLTYLPTQGTLGTLALSLTHTPSLAHQTFSVSSASAASSSSASSPADFHLPCRRVPGQWNCALRDNTPPPPFLRPRQPYSSNIVLAETAPPAAPSRAPAAAQSALHRKELRSHRQTA